MAHSRIGPTSLINSISFKLSDEMDIILKNMYIWKNNSELVNIPESVLKMVAYPLPNLVLRFDIESKSLLQSSKEYNQKKGFYTVKDILNKLISFYNTKHTQSEINDIGVYSQKYGNLLKKPPGLPRRQYLTKRNFAGLKETEQLGVYEVIFE